MKYLDLHLKENLIRQTSFLRKNTSQKPAFFRVKHINLLEMQLLLWNLFDYSIFWSALFSKIVSNVLLDSLVILNAQPETRMDSKTWQCTTYTIFFFFSWQLRFGLDKKPQMAHLVDNYKLLLLITNLTFSE